MAAATDSADAGVSSPRIQGRPWQLWASTAARLILAGVLAVAGGLKVTQPVQAVMAVQAYEVFPPTLGQFLGYARPLFELALALLLLLGVADPDDGPDRGWADGGVHRRHRQRLGARPEHRLRLLRQRRPAPAGGVAVRYLPEILRDLLFLGLASWLAVFPASRLALDKAGLSGAPHDPHHGLVEALGGYSGDDEDPLDPEGVDGEPSDHLDPSDRP